jgi:hypothetical protein
VDVFLRGFSLSSCSQHSLKVLFKVCTQIWTEFFIFRSGLTVTGLSFHHCFTLNDLLSMQSPWPGSTLPHPGSLKLWASSLPQHLAGYRLRNFIKLQGTNCTNGLGTWLLQAPTWSASWACCWMLLRSFWAREAWYRSSWLSTTITTSWVTVTDELRLISSVSSACPLC